MPKRRRNLHHRSTSRSRTITPSLVDHLERQVWDLSGSHLRVEYEPTGLYRNPDFTFTSSRDPNSAPMERVAPSPPTLLPHGLLTARRWLLFGLNNATSMYSTSIRPSTGTREECPGILLCATMELVTILPASKDLGFLRAPGLRWYTLSTLRR